MVSCFLEVLSEKKIKLGIYTLTKRSITEVQIQKQSSEQSRKWDGYVQHVILQTQKTSTKSEASNYKTFNHNCK